MVIIPSCSTIRKSSVRATLAPNASPSEASDGMSFVCTQLDRSLECVQRHTLLHSGDHALHCAAPPQRWSCRMDQWLRCDRIDRPLNHRTPSTSSAPSCHRVTIEDMNCRYSPDDGDAATAVLAVRQHWRQASGCPLSAVTTAEPPASPPSFTLRSMRYAAPTSTSIDAVAWRSDDRSPFGGRDRGSERSPGLPVPLVVVSLPPKRVRCLLHHIFHRTVCDRSTGI